MTSQNLKIQKIQFSFPNVGLDEFSFYRLLYRSDGRILLDFNLLGLLLKLLNK